MKAYTVHAPPENPEDGTRFVFVKDGFSWPALFVPALWMLRYRMWLALVWYVVYVLVVAWIGRIAGDQVATIVAIVGAVLIAFEANNMRRGSLWSRGWDEIGGAYGRNLEEAEIRFFHAPPAAVPATPAPQVTVVRSVYPTLPRPDEDRTVIGLFPEPER